MEQSQVKSERQKRYEKEYEKSYQIVESLKGLAYCRAEDILKEAQKILSEKKDCIIIQ